MLDYVIFNIFPRCSTVTTGRFSLASTILMDTDSLSLNSAMSKSRTWNVFVFYITIIILTRKKVNIFS